MNTRVQVEHCVTEMTTGVDIVKEGIRAAAGEPLIVAQDDVVLRGHAIECRINAEDASKNFAPAPGPDRRATASPPGPACASTPASRAGSEVTPMYDPMVAKLIVWDADREQATQRMLRALAEYEIERPQDADPVPRRAARDRAVGQRRDVPRPARGPRRGSRRSPSRSAEKPAATTASAERRPSSRPTPSRSPAASFDVQGHRPAVRRAAAPRRNGGRARGRAAARSARERAERRRRRAAATTLVSPLQGNMWKVLVERGRPSRRASSSASSRR